MKTLLRVGIAGLGRAGQGMQPSELAAFPDLFRITAGCDVDASRRANLPPPFADATLHADFDHLLADPNVDVVSIATRHADHTPMAIRALDAGRYVVVEKPCALNTVQMDALLAAARRHPDHLFLRLNRRFEAPFQKVLQLMRGGLLGTVNQIKLYRMVGYCRRNDWMTVSSQGGGLFMNWGPHLVDQALQMLESPVVDCWADIRNVISIGDGDDHIKILLRARNGRVADIELSGATTLSGHEIEIRGSRGTLIYPVDGKIKMRFVDPDFVFRPLQAHTGQPPLQYGNFEEHPTFVEQLVDVPAIPGGEIWRRIHASIVRGEAFPVTLEQGAEVIRIIEQAYVASGFKPATAFLGPGKRPATAAS